MAEFYFFVFAHKARKFLFLDSAIFLVTTMPSKKYLKYFILIFEWQEPSFGCFGWKTWISEVEEFFLTKKHAPKFFFCLRICKKLSLFCYWQNLVWATFLGACLLTETVFQLFWKIVMVVRALSRGCMNYIFGKKFLVFYEIFQFPTSRGPFLGKFDFY